VENVIDDIKRQGPRNVCFTGGEPFLQPAAQLYQVMTVLGTDGYTFEFFTNGSILFPSWMRQRHDVYRIRTTIVQDWKLQGSGERDSFLDIRGANRDNLSTRDAIKFTVKDEEDLHEAARVWMSIGAMMDPPLIYVGKVWEATKISDADVVEFILDEKLPWRLNVQLHKHIWPADQRAI
jgi:7-carboxy-7-deazaguanine synthase